MRPFKARCAPDDRARCDQPAAARAGSRRHSDRGRNHRRHLERIRPRSTPSIRAHHQCGARPGPAACCRRIVPRELIERDASSADRRREPIVPLPLASMGPASSLLSNRRSRPSGPDALNVECAALLLGRDHPVETEQRQQRAGFVGVEPAVDPNIGARSAPGSVTRTPRACRWRSRRRWRARRRAGRSSPTFPVVALEAAAVEADAGAQRRGLLAGRQPAQRIGQRRRELSDSAMMPLRSRASR